MENVRRVAVLVVSLFAIFGAEAKADFVSPVGLAPGSQYQVIFVTADTITATSTDISTYNSFVQAEAALDPTLPQGVTWSAVVSTATVNAVTNAPAFALPLYWTDGYGDSADLIGGGGYANVVLYGNNPSFGDELPLEIARYDQYGNLAPGPAGESSREAMGESPLGGSNYGNPDAGNWVFTGTNGSGVKSSFPMGAASGSVTDITYAGPEENSWNFNPNTSVAPASESLHLYALSSIITVPSPEPATISLACAAFLVLGGHSLLRWRRARLPNAA